MIEIISIGLLATIQGRPYRGKRHLGMPLSGPADPLSMAISNHLAGNKSDAASIEFSLIGGTILAHNNCLIGLSGPIKEAIIQRNGTTISCNLYRSILLLSGDILTIKALQAGAHIYMSINGGFNANIYWEGNSTFLPAHMGGKEGKALQSGDLLSYHQKKQNYNDITLPERFRLSYGNHHVMRICADNQQHAKYLTQQRWTIGRQSSRIGYALIGNNTTPGLTADGFSRPVFAGTIQLPQSGNPFLLGVDAQTVGGYPIIGHVIRADRHIIGQIKSTDSLRFIIQKPYEARRVYEKKINVWREYIPTLRLD